MRLDSLLTTKTVAIVGGGPAGLMAAEVLSRAGVQVDLFDAMPSVGRKFLMAGKGGMNLTHAEPMQHLMGRYGARREVLEPWLQHFGPDQLRAWAQGLGVETFVGSSGRVFPVDMKAAPLLRSWLHRLRESGVRFHMRHLWTGWSDQGLLRFTTPAGESLVQADAAILALGGASWPQLGSTGAWVARLEERGVGVAPLRPANCGFELAWGDYLRERFAGAPLKSVALAMANDQTVVGFRQGEMVLSEYGLEGSLIYAESARLRDAIARDGYVTILLDLLPGKSLLPLEQSLRKPRGARSMVRHLRSQAGLDGVKAALLREVLSIEQMNDSRLLAQAIKALPLTLRSPRPIGEAISSAGGVIFEHMDQQLMLRAVPGVFCAGEMLDWEAPTGGYLFTASFATGVAAADGVINWLRH